MTLFQHLELFAIDLSGALLIAATAYAIMRLPWTQKETEITWSLMVARLRHLFILPTPDIESKARHSAPLSSSRRWIPIKVVEPC